MNNKIYFGDHHMHFISSESQVSENEAINFYELSLKKGSEFARVCRDFLNQNRSIQLLLRDIPFELVLEELKKTPGVLERISRWVYHIFSNDSSQQEP